MINKELFKEKLRKAFAEQNDEKFMRMTPEDQENLLLAIIRGYEEMNKQKHGQNTNTI